MPHQLLTSTLTKTPPLAPIWCDRATGGRAPRSLGRGFRHLEAFRRLIVTSVVWRVEGLAVAASSVRRLIVTSVVWRAEGLAVAASSVRTHIREAGERPAERAWHPARAHQKHLRWTMHGPCSSYSDFSITVAPKVESDARMAPPIQTPSVGQRDGRRRTGGGCSIWLSADSRVSSSDFSRDASPGKLVLPPASKNVTTKGFNKVRCHRGQRVGDQVRQAQFIIIKKAVAIYQRST